MSFNGDLLREAMTTQKYASKGTKRLAESRINESINSAEEIMEIFDYDFETAIECVLGYLQTHNPQIIDDMLIEFSEIFDEY